MSQNIWNLHGAIPTWDDLSPGWFKGYVANHVKQGERIGLVIASHPHVDHIGNMAWLIENYGVDTYVDNGFRPPEDHDGGSHASTFDQIEQALQTKPVKHLHTKDGVPDLGPWCPKVKLEILRPSGFEIASPDPNMRSVVLRITYGDDTFLFTGDGGDHSEKDQNGEEKLFERDSSIHPKLKAKFLKVAHHGSDSASAQAFLDLVQPEIAVISCGDKDRGKNQGYKHPRLDVINRLLAKARDRETGEGTPTIDALDGNAKTGTWKRVTLNKAVYETEAEGDLHFVSSGSGIHRVP